MISSNPNYLPKAHLVFIIFRVKISTYEIRRLGGTQLSPQHDYQKKIQKYQYGTQNSNELALSLFFQSYSCQPVQFPWIPVIPNSLKMTCFFHTSAFANSLSSAWNTVPFLSASHPPRFGTRVIFSQKPAHSILSRGRHFSFYAPRKSRPDLYSRLIQMCIRHHDY